MNFDDALVWKIYDGVLDKTVFQSALDDFTAAVGASGCIVFEFVDQLEKDILHAPYFSSKYDAEDITHYLDIFEEQELKDQMIFERHSLEHDKIDLIDDSVLADSDEELFRKPNVKALHQFGLPYRSAGLLDKDNRSNARFSIQLSGQHGRMSDAERAIARYYLPHFAKALSLMRPFSELRRIHSAVLAAMDKLRIGVCVVDAGLRAVEKNTEFKRQLAEYPTLRIDRFGRLHMKSDHGQRSLFRFLAEPASHGTFGARPRKEAIVTEDGGMVGPLCVEVSPLQKLEELGSSGFSGAVIYSLDTSAPLQLNFERASLAFRLTKAEAALLPLICQGLTNLEVADRKERSVPTINSQVKSVLAKTHCSNRTQLVRLMMSYNTSLLAL